MYEVSVLDNFSTGHRSNLDHCLDSVDLVEGDIRDMEIIEDAVAGVDMILHQAALPSVPRSIRAPITSNDVNVGGTLKLLSAAHKAGVSRVIFASSSSVYGNSAELPKVEVMIPNPLSPYAVSKLTGEYYLNVFAKLYNIETLAIRYFNVFGPRQDPRSVYSGVISKFMKSAIEGKKYEINGDGSTARDFTFIDNVVHANLLALEADTLNGEVINVACGSKYSLNQLVSAIDKVAGVNLPVKYGPSRMGDVKFSLADISAAKKLLGYEPQIQFEEGIQRTFEWYMGKHEALESQ
jgi:UDP-glucose 4-epimerase